MAVTAQLVYKSPHRLRYLLTQDGQQGTTVTIPNTPGGGVSPDLATDTADLPAGARLSQIVRARIEGYGPIAAGALTQAQARALLLSWDPTNAVRTNDNIVLARCELAPVDVAGASAVDAGVDGQGDPVLLVTMPAAAQKCFLDVVTEFMG